jgi:hypothetical protein
MNVADALRGAGPLLASMGIALVLTIAVEAPAAALLGYRTRHAIAIVALVNVATNPPLNFLLNVIMLYARSRSLADPPALVALVLLEVAVVLVEWRVLAWALPDLRRRALPVALAMNAASLAVGLAILG